MLSTVAVPAAGQTAGFDDVPPTNAHADAIAEAADLGIIAGTTPTTFEPARAVTRGQIASLLVATLGEADVDLPPLAGSPEFDDVALRTVTPCVDWPPPGS
ncbi:MAG: S-layer homology domain-containing protein [Nitriliruptor sp.]|uniref:S-layer homology domain-containing protein n=1 Tax=Nitriliruptor sp. TaxID=2448056 RepID=UPI0034A03FB4